MLTLSIIIPVFNTELMFVKKCLFSLRDVPEHDFEVIIVDDGSNSCYRASLSNLVLSQGLDVHYYEKDNGGQNSARQFGVEKAKGKYILFLDSDDYVDPTALHTAIEHLKENKPKILAYNYSVVDITGKTLETHSLWEDGYRRMDISKGVRVVNSLWQAIYSIDVLKRPDISLIQGPRIGEDLSSAISILITTADAHTLGVNLYRYVHRPSSILRQVSQERVNDIVWAFDLMLQQVGCKGNAYAEELEWVAILHVLGWGGLRAIKAYGASGEIKRELFDWMSSRFPKWEDNSYLRTEKISKSIWFRAIINGNWAPISVLLNLRNLYNRTRAIIKGRQ